MVNLKPECVINHEDLCLSAQEVCWVKVQGDQEESEPGVFVNKPHIIKVEV